MSRSSIEKPGIRILKNGGWLLGGKTVGAVLSIIYLAMITRNLGPENFGKFALIFSFAQAIAGIISFQTWQIIIRYGTKYVLEKAVDDFARLIMLCLALDVIGILLGTVLTLTAVYGFAGYFGWDAAYSLKISIFTFVILLSTRGTAIGILRVHDRFRDAALADSLVPIIRFVGVGVAVFLGGSIDRFLFVWAFSEMAATAIMWIIIARTMPLHLGQQNWRHIGRYYRKYTDLTRFAAFTNLGSSLRLMSQQLIVLIVGFYTGPAAAGFFRLGHQLGQVVARIADGISFAIYTEYSRITQSAGSGAARSMIGRTMRVTAVSAAILLAILLLAGKPLIIMIFGPDYAPAYPLVLLLGGAAAVQVAAMALEPVLMTHGRAGWVLIANAVGVGVMALLLPLLMPELEATGAAIAVLVGAALTAISLALAFRFMSNDQQTPTI
ncbi:lipopolysaccharide biosynthesis protein [Sphingorhabdus arenilitoris]|uniref:Lipopolysaccharide biosynthesis protein n=1 Tax=Sphingorhabdus arenilitoris TaxID=1490041 RepID=A0ABV8RF01_9SPHN